MTTRAALAAAMDGTRGHRAADLLCQACVDLLGVDAAAISLVFGGVNSGTLGASGGTARMLDELQFTLGEGPCLDAVAQACPVLVSDLADPADTRWPTYARALTVHNVRSVSALPVVVAGGYAGALDLFRAGPGYLSDQELSDALCAAELAQLPLLDLLGHDVLGTADQPLSVGWDELRAISRVEVNQATGFLAGQLDVSPPEALVRLRTHAFAHDMSAIDVARKILDRRLDLRAVDDAADHNKSPGQTGVDRKDMRSD